MKLLCHWHGRRVACNYLLSDSKLLDARIPNTSFPRARSGGAIDGRSSLRRSKHASAHNTAGIPTPISRRCADTSIFGWSALAAFCGRRRRRSQRRRYATCCSEAIARLPPRGSPSRARPGHPWRGYTSTISGTECSAYATMSSCSSPGTETKPSLLARETLDPSAPQNEDSFIPIAYWFFLCERHDRLTGNINFQDNLLNVLLTRSLPWEMTAPPP
jgi:hypothetical protein